MEYWHYIIIYLVLGFIVSTALILTNPPRKVDQFSGFVFTRKSIDWLVAIPAYFIMIVFWPILIAMRLLR